MLPITAHPLHIPADTCTQYFLRTPYLHSTCRTNPTLSTLSAPSSHAVPNPLTNLPRQSACHPAQQPAMTILYNASLPLCSAACRVFLQCSTACGLLWRARDYSGPDSSPWSGRDEKRHDPRVLAQSHVHQGFRIHECPRPSSECLKLEPFVVCSGSRSQGEKRLFEPKMTVRSKEQAFLPDTSTGYRRLNYSERGCGWLKHNPS